MDISPLQQTFLDVRTDTALSGHDLGKLEPVEVAGGPCFERLVECVVALWK